MNIRLLARVVASLLAGGANLPRVWGQTDPPTSTPSGATSTSTPVTSTPPTGDPTPSTTVTSTPTTSAPVTGEPTTGEPTTGEPTTSTPTGNGTLTTASPTSNGTLTTAAPTGNGTSTPAASPAPTPSNGTSSSPVPAPTPASTQSPSPSAPTVPAPPCTTNLFDVIDIQNRAIEDGTLDETRWIVLCPNSEITSSVGDSSFFYIFTPNMRVTCGEDGSSSNDCTVLGNQGQPVIVWLAPGFDAEFNYGQGQVRILDNIVFSGVTFTGLDWSYNPSSQTGANAVWMTVPGSATFTDCHWTNNLAQRLILTTVQSRPDGSANSRRHLNLEEEQIQVFAHYNHQRTLGRVEAQRRLQTDYTMRAVFDSCNFTGNFLRESVFTVVEQDAEVLLSNVLLDSNDLRQPEIGLPEAKGFTSLIEVNSLGHLEVYNSTFTNNVVDPAPVTVENATFFAENNVFANNGDNLSCDAFLVVAEGSTLYTGDITWRDAANECVTEVLAPIAAPTASPAPTGTAPNVTTMSPSAAPNVTTMSPSAAQSTKNPTSSPSSSPTTVSPSTAPGSGTSSSPVPTPTAVSTQSPSPSAPIVPAPPCTTNLFDVIDIQNRAIEDGTLDETRWIVLCPNSEITSIVGDSSFFYIFTPNMRVTCGEDGSSSNDCTVLGYRGQPVIVWLAPGFDADFNFGQGKVRVLDNIVFSGVTFNGLDLSFNPSSNSGAYAAWLTVPGSVTFTDCHWTNNLAQRLILTQIQATPDDNASSRRHLNLEKEQDHVFAPKNHQRTSGRVEVQHRLQTDYIMEAVFDSCNFTGNLLRESVFTIFGQGAEVLFRNVFFDDNNLREPGVGLPEEEGFTPLIELGFGGHLEVYNSTFTSNFVDPAPVTVENATFFAKNNVFTNNGENLSCDAFLAVAENSTLYTGDSTWRDATYECVTDIIAPIAAPIVSPAPTGNASTTAPNITTTSPSAAPSNGTSSSPMPTQSPSPSAPTVPAPPCTTNLFNVIDIQNRAIEDGTLDETRWIVLCPNSAITSSVAFTSFFYIFTPNMRVTCGEDGSSNNDCVVVGNQGQPVIVWLAPGFDADFNYGQGEVRILDNVVFSGVTFTGLDWSYNPSSQTGANAVWLTVPGSVTFTDCHWTNNLAQRLILAAVQSTPSRSASSRRRLNLGEEQVQVFAHYNHQRTLSRVETQHRLQTDYSMEAVFESCNFTGNLLRESVITIVGQEAQVLLGNVFFDSNNLKEPGIGLPEEEGFTSLIEVNSLGHLEVYRSTFTNNLVDPAPVTVENATFYSENNVFTNNGANLACDAFLAVAEDSTFYTGNITWRDAAYECVTEVASP